MTRDELCWHDRFHPTHEPCPNVARWRGPDDGEHPRGSKFTRRTRWCDAHRHEIDVAIDAARPR